MASGAAVKYLTALLSLLALVSREAIAASASSTLRLDVISHTPLHKLMVIVDGEPVLNLARRKWAIVYVERNFNYAYALTNPIYLE